MNPAAIKKIGGAALAILLLAAGLILFFCDPVRVPIYPQCLFHQMTGLDCPGCGSLRAMHALLHGQLAAALHFNAFLVLSLLLFAGIGFEFFRRKMKRENALPFNLRWMWLYFGAFLIFGIARDLPVPLFAAFAP